MKKTSSLPINLDERVIFTLITSSVISISIMLWSFQASNIRSCSPGKISFSSGIHTTGEPVHFSVTGLDTYTKNKSWDFGDRFKQVDNGNAVYHVYNKPGSYRVNVSGGDLCSVDTVITIVQQSIPPDLVPQFSGPEKAFVGEKVPFKDSTPGAVSWEWRFGETLSVNDTVQNPKYAFATPGIKTVILTVNGKMQGELVVDVQNKTVGTTVYKPPVVYGKPTDGRGPTGRELHPVEDTSIIVIPPVTEPTGYDPVVTENFIKHMLYDVVDGILHESDFAKDLCHQNINVEYNGDQITFHELCKTLRGIRKSKRIKELTVKLSAEKGCINYMTITLRKKTLLELVTEKIL